MCVGRGRHASREAPVPFGTDCVRAIATGSSAGGVDHQTIAVARQLPPAIEMDGQVGRNRCWQRREEASGAARASRRALRGVRWGPQHRAARPRREEPRRRRVRKKVEPRGPRAGGQCKLDIRLLAKGSGDAPKLLRGQMRGGCGRLGERRVLMPEMQRQQRPWQLVALGAVELREDMKVGACLWRLVELLLMRRPCRTRRARAVALHARAQLTKQRAALAACRLDAARELCQAHATR